MAKLNSNFKAFLSAIEPDPRAVKHAMNAHEPIREHLESDNEFKSHVKGTFLYGSYKRHTSIGSIKDVDIVVLTDFDPNQSDNNPQTVLKTLKIAINRYYKDTENQQYQRRSIRVDDPLPDMANAALTLDIIPAFAPSGEDQPLLVPDRELKEWVLSHPKGHIEFTRELNDEHHSNGMFVPMAKIMKFWWKYQCEIRQPKVDRPKPKGFWIEVMAGQFYDLSKVEFADQFIAVLEGALAVFSASGGMLQLKDPGLHEQFIKMSITKNESEVFLKAMQESLDTARKAIAETNELQSSIIWQKIFGKKFPLSKSGIEKVRSFSLPCMPGPLTPPIPPRKREAG